MKGLYPKISQLVELIRRKTGRVLTFILMIFMALDICISVLAFLRFPSAVSSFSFFTSFTDSIGTFCTFCKEKTISGVTREFTRQVGLGNRIVLCDYVIEELRLYPCYPSPQENFADLSPLACRPVQTAVHRKTAPKSFYVPMQDYVKEIREERRGR